LLVIAATIRLDAGYKAPTKLLATLTAIRENPKLVLSDTIEPEARGVLAAAYQRANEPAGTFWFDIDVESNGELAVAIGKPSAQYFSTSRTPPPVRPMVRAKFCAALLP
jgi:hypothetical protein